MMPVVPLRLPSLREVSAFSVNYWDELHRVYRVALQTASYVPKHWSSCCKERSHKHL